MLYQPTFPSPYLETIDVENPQGNVFKCLINPKNKVIGYKISILLNEDNTLCSQIKGFIKDIDGVSTQKKIYSIDGGTTWTEFQSIPEEDSMLPLVGNFSDDSWLQVILPSDVDLGLSNNNEYKWNITLEQEKYDIKVLTGTSPKNGYSTSRYICLEPSPLIQAGLMVDTKTNTDGILHHIIESITYCDSSGKTIDVITNAAYIRAYLKDYSFTEEVSKGTAYTIYDKYLISYDYYFKTRAIPTVSFEVQSTITKSSNVFVATVGKNISSYKFDLYLGAELIDTSENIYSNDISYVYDGFISGNKYSIKLTVITEDDETIIEERDFNVLYNISQDALLVQTEIDNKTNGVYLDFSKQASIPGTLVNGDAIYEKRKNSKDEVPEVENTIHLNRSQSLYWNTVNNTKDLIIPNNSATLIHWHGDSGFNGNILEMTSNEFTNERIIVGYNSKTFYYKIGTGDVIQYNPYTNGYANAIAGRDGYSVAGQIIECNSNTVVVPLTDMIQAGMYISVLGERKLITDVSNKTNTTLTIESPFSINPSSGDNFFAYDELRCYVFSEDDIPEDTDIFVENDLGYNYWWLIVILPSGVQFIKTQRYEDTAVSE